MKELSPHSTKRHASRFQRFRYRLGQHDAVLPLALIAIPCGFLTGLLINLFRLGIESVWMLTEGAKQLAADETTGNTLQAFLTSPLFYVPTLSALVLGVVYQFLKQDTLSTGLTHVAIRLHKHYGHMPIRNAIVQFLGGIFALGCGHSGGREGPAIHIGAAANSFLSRRLHLPNNSIRILIACGSASAIGASFNTPIAGVIFAIEVIMMEYTLVSFVPIVVSSIAATTVTQILYGNTSVFSVPTITNYSLWEIPWMLLFGFTCGLAAILFMRVQLAAQKLRALPISLRFVAAGLLTGTIAFSIPQVLGIGYTHVNEALSGQLPWLVLFTLCLAKIVASAVSNGVGMPVGIIGPSLVIGASLGSLFGATSDSLFPSVSSGAGFYALLGMGGVMAGILNAPLAALIAILELAHTPAALLPSIIVIVTASLFTDQIFGQRSAIETVLNQQGIHLSSHPVEQALNRISMSAVADTQLKVFKGEILAEELRSTMLDPPRHIIVATEIAIPDSETVITTWRLSRKSFTAYCESLQASGVSPPQSAETMAEQLTEYDYQLSPLMACSAHITVTEARKMLQENTNVDGLLITDPDGPLRGILLREALDRLIDNW